jgi:hypothetical protein
LDQPPLWGVLASKVGRAFKLSDTGVERAVLMVERAEVPQPGIRLSADPFHDCLSDARLADSGFARDQHHLSFTPLRPLPAAQQQLDLFGIQATEIVEGPLQLVRFSTKLL